MAGTVVFMGLAAGLFLAFSSSVMPGLHGADDRTFIEVMQDINRVSENPAFLAPFLIAPVLAVWALVNESRRGTPAGVRWMITAVALSAVWFIVTMAISVPLNYELIDAGDPAKLSNPAAVRDDFETPWVVWNIIRTVTSVGALLCLMRVVLQRRG